MSAYRLYRLDGSGKIDSGDWIDCSADHDAVAEARVRIPTGGFELWQGQWLVCRERRNHS